MLIDCYMRAFVLSCVARSLHPHPHELYWPATSLLSASAYTTSMSVYIAWAAMSGDAARVLRNAPRETSANGTNLPSSTQRSECATRSAAPNDAASKVSLATHLHTEYRLNID